MLRLSRITRSYAMGDVVVDALKGVDIEIDEGEFIAIMGPSGSGKSTLMNIIGCLDTPTSGTYLLDGRDVSDLKDDRLAKERNQKISLVFQTFNMLSRATALENVELPLIYSGVSHRAERARAALEMVGLANRARHRPNELSGGQQQRVAIARALVTNPAIVLADEPTGNLDSRASQDIMRILRTLNEERGITLVLVTHDENVAAHAHRLIHILDGRLTSDS